MDTPALGAHESPPDSRHWTLASVGAPTAYPPAASIDLVKALIVKNQGKIGSCVGNTFEEGVRLIRWIISLQADPNAQQEELSWRFIYAVCKCLDGIADQGTFPTLAAKVIRTYGVPLASFCPNDITLDHESFVYQRTLTNIPQAAFTDASTRKAGADLVPTEGITEAGIKQAITYARDNKGFVAILRQVGNSYWTDEQGNSTWDKVKLEPIRTPNPVVGGHEELLYAYDIDPANGRTRIYWLNHWSPQWNSTGGVSDDGGFAWEYLDEWLSFVKELRIVVPALPSPPATFRYTFTKTLSVGAQGPDVVALQHVLSLEGCYPSGQAFTGFYGVITRAGVKQLQEKYASVILTPIGLTHGTGVFGNATMAWTNKKYGAV